MRLATCSLATLFPSATIAALVGHAATLASPEDQAILAPIHALFDGMARRDAAAIQLPLLPGGALRIGGIPLVYRLGRRNPNPFDPRTL